MEWLAQGIDKIMQSQVWRFVSTHFYWVDWLTLFCGLGGLIYGMREGFLRTLVKTAEVVFIAYVTFVYREFVSSQLHIYFSFLSPKLLPAGGFLVIALPLGIVVLLIDAQVRQIFHTTLAGPVRLIGGVVTGVFYGLFLWSFISQALILTPNRSLQKAYEKGISISGPLIKDFAPRIYRKAKR